MSELPGQASTTSRATWCDTTLSLSYSSQSCREDAVVTDNHNGLRERSFGGRGKELLVIWESKEAEAEQ